MFLVVHICDAYPSISLLAPCGDRKIEQAMVGWVNMMAITVRTHNNAIEILQTTNDTAPPPPPDVSYSSQWNICVTSVDSIYINLNTNLDILQMTHVYVIL